MEIHVHLKVEVHVHQTPAEPAKAKGEDKMLSRLFEEEIQRASTTRSHSTMNNYHTAVNSFLSYAGAEASVASLNEQLVSGYEHWLRQRGVCLNTISCYMRSLRSLLGKSGHDVGGVFEAVYTGKARTEKRSIALDAVKRLRDLSLSPGSFAELARDVFLFSFYAMGMPFVDVAHLKSSQVEERQIVYHRQKTGQRICVTLEPPLKAILRRHARADSRYAFPLLSEGTDREYLKVLGRYNRALHSLQVKAGIKQRLTSYVVRHTWASTAYKSNVELNVIARALGHTNPQTTLTYIREIDDRQLSTANRKIIGALTERPR